METYPEKTFINYEYEDGFQAGLETETCSELITRVAQSLSDPDTPCSWTYGLAQGWISKRQID
jgi:hypothetical protein